MTRYTTIGLTALLFSALGGCAAAPPVGHQDGRGSATASIWALWSLQNRTIPRSGPDTVTLRLLPDHGIAGTAGCNDVGGREFTWAASTDTRGTFARDPAQPTIMTVVGCNDAAAMETAARFWTLMTKAKGWSIERSDLVIRFDDGTTALLKPIGPAPARPDDCRNADPNNFDCLRKATTRGAKPR